MKGGGGSVRPSRCNRVSWGEEGLWSGDQGRRTDEINKQMDDIATTTARC